jgi:lysozyme family protein
MQHPFPALAPEYAALLAVMRLDPAREHELAVRAAVLLALSQRHRDEWAAVEAKTGVPRLWGLASFERESGSDYARSPAQGDRWDRVSVNVPRGLGPYQCWGDACVAAYRIDRLDEVVRGLGSAVGSQDGAASSLIADPSHPIPGSGWTWPRACFEGELFNGFGPRAHGRQTGYLWSWTNIYTGGKYVADGKWDPDHVDEQCGMVPMMAALLRLDSSLALADAPPWSAAPGSAGPEPSPKGPPAPLPTPTVPPAPHSAPTIPPPNLPAVFDPKVTAWLQAALNRLNATEGFSNDPPLVVDGSYGRHTRRAVTAFQAARGLVPDGLAGPLTIAEIRKQETGVGRQDDSRPPEVSDS